VEPLLYKTIPLSFEGERCKRRVKERRSLSCKSVPLPLIKGKGIKVEDSSRDRVTKYKGVR